MKILNRRIKVKKKSKCIPKKEPKTRKEKRKEGRKAAKLRKHEFFAKKKNVPGKFVKISELIQSSDCPNTSDDNIKRKLTSENKKEQRLKEQMQIKRRQQLREANKQEDKLIKRLEKHLRLNKRKTKSVPKSFTEDGLDYLLDVCDGESLKEAVKVEQNLYESGSEFEDDFAIATGKQFEQDSNFDVDTEGNLEGDGEGDYDGDDDGDDVYQNINCSQGEKCGKFQLGSEENDTETDSNDNDNHNINRTIKSKKVHNRNDMEQCASISAVKKIKLSGSSIKDSTCNVKSNTPIADVECFSDSERDGYCNHDELTSDEQGKEQYWEDIYGRTRDKKGNIVEDKVSKSKYVPPQLRGKSVAQDNKRNQACLRLHKQMKGLLNRLAESNMANIANQVEELYMSNSRNDMNETLSELLLDSLVAEVLTPERLIMEHVMLVAILHANVGTEIGTYILQIMVKEFNKLLDSHQSVENKTLDNVTLLICYLYNFKVSSCLLMFNILEKLAENFNEKSVELILLILRSIGFSLRKDDPMALKNLILCLQQNAASAAHLRESNRVKFMLDVLLAVKNNNMSKIPNYDPSHCEHLKKVLKGLLRKGSYISEIKISLEDLLKADYNGRWWVVGSAWTGAHSGEKLFESDDKAKINNEIHNHYNQKLLTLARKQRMNTDLRREIFCIVMTAEDYLDSFEKLLHLGLKNHQEREIIHIIMDCCLHEKKFNPYYGHLLQKFCDFDRKYQMVIQYAVWDKVKEVQNMLVFQVTNLAQLLIHLFIQKGLPLSVLKVIHFSEVDKATVRLMRQVILGILLHKSETDMRKVFERVAVSPKLKLFREGLKIFIKHFLLKNTSSLPPEDVENLKKRADVAEKALSLEVNIKL